MGLTLTRPLTLRLDTDGSVTCREPHTNREVSLSLPILGLLSAMGGGQSPEDWAADNGVDGESLAGVLATLTGAHLVGEPAAAASGAAGEGWPVFLVGCHRSGTTLVRYLLDSHPNIACPPESKFITGLKAFVEFPQVWQALESMGFGSADIRGAVRTMIESFMGQYAARMNKPRWADKTPNYFTHLDFIDEVFEGRLSWVFLVRSPLDTVQSLFDSFVPYGILDPDIREVALEYGHSRPAFARYWVTVNERIELFATAHPERCHFLKYEDVVARPEETLATMFRFVGEELPPNLVETAFAAHHDVGMQDRKILDTKSIQKDRVARWKGWPEGETRAVCEIVGATAQRLGYELPFT